jgi:hypothetical protein
MPQPAHATKRTWAARFLSVLALCSLVSVVFASPLPARAGVSLGVSVSFGPPAIPYYVQPPAPDPNYIWSPGYWAYDRNDGGYYWVPGTWVPAPAVGVYWTPGYWGWNGAAFVFNAGDWGPSVGYYGGVNYGYGYYGNGYAGGRWDHNRFMYNTAITRVGGGIHNTYVNRGVVNNQWNRTSYNGGRGGINARPTSNQLAAARQRRFGPTSVQSQHQTYAAQNRANYSSVNHGRPATVAVARPYSASNRPAGARTAAATARTTHTTTARTAAAHAAPRTAVAHTAVNRTATAHTATAVHRNAAPAHAAPVARAPVTHAAPVARAQTEPREAPQRMTLQRAMPAQRAAAPPQRAMAAPRAPAAAPRAQAAPRQQGHPPQH